MLDGTKKMFGYVLITMKASDSKEVELQGAVSSWFLIWIEELLFRLGVGKGRWDLNLPSEKDTQAKVSRKYVNYCMF